MPINAGKMEILRDFWNTEHHRITKLEQVRQLTPIPIHLDAEIKLHYNIEKILNDYDNDDEHNNLSLIKKSITSLNDSGDYDNDNDDKDNKGNEIKW